MYGKIIRFMRISKRLKQTEVSSIVGISNSTLAHYESEYRAITLEMAKLVADACGYEILFKDKEKNRVYKLEDINVDYDVRVTTK
jgi:transcriptional regulator with XRE-family HTH domain